MIVVYCFYPGDEKLALANAQWMHELGGCKGHQVFMGFDKRCNPGTVDQIAKELGKSFDVVHRHRFGAEVNGWPEGANYFFRTVAAILQDGAHGKEFFWLEPDSIPITPGWLDCIQKEHGNALKPFTGARVEVENIPLHMSGVGIYPNPLHAFAGEAYRAHDTAWDMAAKDQIVPQAHFTNLIEHSWKHPKFTSIDELRTQMAPETMLFHSSKDGSLIDLLRRRRTDAPEVTPNMPGLTGSTPVVANAAPKTEFTATTVPRTDHGSSLEEIGDREAQPTCDIFIRTYPGDYEWLQYCLRSINKYCSGFRKIWIISPQAAPMDMTSLGYEWKQMNDESPDGYLAQQITKLYADVITDYQPDYILHVDSDVIFKRPCSPKDFFAPPSKDDPLGETLIWYYTPYPSIETPWQPVTEKFMCKEVQFEFMRRFPIMLPRWLYPKLREYCFAKHKMVISDYIKLQPQRSFSEFNALGAYAYYQHHNKFHWVDTIQTQLGHMPEPFARQFHSWGGITPEVKDEINQILGGTGVSTTAVAHIPAVESSPESSVPSQIKVLPNDIWVLHGDQISGWVEQEGRLDHDQNLLPVILPHINPGDCVVDGGAFIGDHTIAYLKVVGPSGKVYAFEPNPLAMQCLMHNIPDGKSLHTHAVALGDKVSFNMPLSSNNNNLGGAYLGDHMPVTNVAVIPMDAYYLSPDFIKLDLEGYELKALRGMERTLKMHHPKMVLEINREALKRQGDKPENIFEWLKNHDYEFSILQENCEWESPMYDILCVHKSPEVSVTGKGDRDLTRCISEPPPVTPTPSAWVIDSAVLYLKEQAARDRKYRQLVMYSLWKHGLTPHSAKKKKQRHEPVHPPVQEKVEMEAKTGATPPGKNKRAGRNNSQRLVPGENKATKECSTT